jgi:hypothetical protein
MSPKSFRVEKDCPFLLAIKKTAVGRARLEYEILFEEKAKFTHQRPNRVVASQHWGRKRSRENLCSVPFQ